MSSLNPVNATTSWTLVQAGPFVGSIASLTGKGVASSLPAPAGTYYGRLQTLTGGVAVNDAAQFLYHLIWEERAS